VEEVKGHPLTHGGIDLIEDAQKPKELKTETMERVGGLTKRKIAGR